MAWYPSGDLLERVRAALRSFQTGVPFSTREMAAKVEPTGLVENHRSDVSLALQALRDERPSPLMYDRRGDGKNWTRR